MEEVAEHSSREDCWIVLHGQVYDVTCFLPLHPGGADVILAVAGTDATDNFNAVHPHKLGELENQPTVRLKGRVAALNCGIPTSRPPPPSSVFGANLGIHGLLLALLRAFRVVSRVVLHGSCTIASIIVIASGKLTAKASIVSFGLVWVYIGVCMSVCLHRYFSHGAFSTSRAFQVILAVTSCFAGQGGHLWWASKHNRHHAYCDLPNDPHSTKQHGTAYAWLGWFFSPGEAHVDRAYIKRFNDFPELVIIDDLWFVPPLVVVLAAYRWWGFHYTVTFLTHPMLMCWVVTLYFNVEYHPASASAPDDDACVAIDRVVVTSEIVGESHHADHHDYPQKALRPGLDLPGRLIIQPLLRAGLIWFDPAEHEPAKEHAH